MNISKLALIALLGGALTAFGCSEDDKGGGGAGGGAGGSGGSIDPVCQPVTQTCESGTSAAIVECPAVDCDLATPPTDDVCTGTESLDNPASCAASGTEVTHILTFMALDEECNNGNELDGCNGNSCKNGDLNLLSEGTDGVDNGLASIATTVVTLADVDLSGVQQAFYNSLCGLKDNPKSGTCLDTGVEGCPGRTCTGGANDGELCTSDALCPGGTCNTDDGCPEGTGMLCDSGTNEGDPCTTTDDCPLSGGGDGCVPAGTCVLLDDDCLEPIAPLTLEFVVDANVAANCANVTVVSQGLCSDSGTCSDTATTMCASHIDCPAGETCDGATACTSDTDCTAPATCTGGGISNVILNLSTPANAGDPVCASGTLGTIPAVVTGVPGAFGNTVIRMTVSEGGFSNGLLGATADAATATAIAAAISPVAAQLVGGIFDINADLSGDTAADCNAVSLTLDIGGVTGGNGGNGGNGG